LFFCSASCGRDNPAPSSKRFPARTAQYTLPCCCAQATESAPTVRGRAALADPHELPTQIPPTRGSSDLGNRGGPLGLR